MWGVPGYSRSVAGVFDEFLMGTDSEIELPADYHELLEALKTRISVACKDAMPKPSRPPDAPQPGAHRSDKFDHPE